jgi:cysteine synthase A
MNNTPLIYIKSLSKLTGFNIYAKCEYLLPFTSKDRVIKNIIIQAEKNGKLKKIVLYMKEVQEVQVIVSLI